MIRPFTCLCMMLAAGSGLYLYQEKHRSQLLDQDITKILNAADANRDRMRVLRAEYQLLQDPTRLGELAAQHLSLAKTDPKQFVTWATLEKTLPVVIAPPPDAERPPAVVETPMAALTTPASPSAPTAAVPMTIARADVAPRPAPAARPAATTPTAAPIVAASSAAPVVAPRIAAPSPMFAANAAQRSALGAVRDPVQPAFAQMRPVAPVAQSVMMATPRRYAYQAQTTVGADGLARFAGVPTSAYQPPVASALGMARTMSAPSYVPPANTGWTPNGG